MDFTLSPDPVCGTPSPPKQRKVTSIPPLCFTPTQTDGDQQTSSRKKETGSIHLDLCSLDQDHTGHSKDFSSLVDSPDLGSSKHKESLVPSPNLLNTPVVDIRPHHHGDVYESPKLPVLVNEADKESPTLTSLGLHHNSSNQARCTYRSKPSLPRDGIKTSPYLSERVSSLGRSSPRVVVETLNVDNLNTDVMTQRNLYMQRGIFSDQEEETDEDEEESEKVNSRTQCWLDGSTSVGIKSSVTSRGGHETDREPAESQGSAVSILKPEVKQLGPHNLTRHERRSGQPYVKGSRDHSEQAGSVDAGDLPHNISGQDQPYYLYEYQPTQGGQGEQNQQLLVSKDGQHFVVVPNQDQSSWLENYNLVKSESSQNLGTTLPMDLINDHGSRSTSQQNPPYSTLCQPSSKGSSAIYSPTSLSYSSSADCPPPGSSLLQPLCLDSSAPMSTQLSFSTQSVTDSSGMKKDSTSSPSSSSKTFTGTPHPVMTGRTLLASQLPKNPKSQPDSPQFHQPSSRTLWSLSSKLPPSTGLHHLNLNSSGSEEEESSTARHQAEDSKRLNFDMHGQLNLAYSATNSTQFRLPSPPSHPTALKSAAARRVQMGPIDMYTEREQHNANERARRARIKNACDHLRDLVPGVTSRTDKATLLMLTAEYLNYLRSIIGIKYDKDFLERIVPSLGFMMESESLVDHLQQPRPYQTLKWTK